jgi:hypothetical protein
VCVGRTIPSAGELIFSVDCQATKFDVDGLAGIVGTHGGMYSLASNLSHFIYQGHKSQCS